QLIVLFPAQMLDCSNQYAAPDQELMLGRRQMVLVPNEVGPVRSLPVPRHERLGPFLSLILYHKRERLNSLPWLPERNAAERIFRNYTFHKTIAIELHTD